jgi:hypothetical protein
MSAVREACPNCQLPFYTERNTECPYCGTGPGHDSTASAQHPTGDASTVTDTTLDGSVARETPPDRPRTTCAHCGTAGVSPTVTSGGATAGAAGESGDGETATTPGQRPPAGNERTKQGSDDATGSSGGLLASLKRLVGR